LISIRKLVIDKMDLSFRVFTDLEKTKDNILTKIADNRLYSRDSFLKTFDAASTSYLSYLEQSKVILSVVGNIAFTV
jgi:hypothetical protein